MCDVGGRENEQREQDREKRWSSKKPEVERGWTEGGERSADHLQALTTQYNIRDIIVN